MPRPRGRSGRARPRNGSLSGSGDAGCRPARSSATFRVPGTVLPTTACERSFPDRVEAIPQAAMSRDSGPMKPRPLPSSLGRVFSVAAAKDAGVSPRRLRSRDLDRPFRGVRVRFGSPAADDVDAHLRAVLAYAATMPEAQFFSHVTAAVLWGLPLPQDVLRAAMPDVAVLGPGRTPRSGGVRGHRLVHASTRVCRHPLWGVQVLAPASTWATLGAVLPDVRDLVAAGDAVVRAPCSVGIRPHWRRSTTSRHPSQADGGLGWSGCVSRFRSCENGRHPAPRPGAVSR